MDLRNNLRKCPWAVGSRKAETAISILAQHTLVVNGAASVKYGVPTRKCIHILARPVRPVKHVFGGVLSLGQGTKRHPLPLYSPRACP